MEEWEQLIEEYHDRLDVKSFIKILKTADVVFKHDLALFESEWIISTLFFKPVNLFETVSSKLNDTAWSKPIGDAFKLISYVVEKYSPDHLYENIVTLCLLPYSPQVRKDALVCLSKVARASPEGARETQRFISELGDLNTCKTQLAVLVGVICECHPEVVADSAPRIWRIYLNLLDSNKNTDTVTNSVLQGLLGLFKHFGAELPVMEFRDLYEKLSKEYLMKSKCEEACLLILEQYSNLFKELVSRDVKLRQELWTKRAECALKAVYGTLATAVNKEQLQKIAEFELLPRISSRNSQVKYTALRILRKLTSDHGVAVTCTDNTDAPALAYEARRGRVSLDIADAIQWCIESNSLYSDKLLQTAVLFYDNIPATKRRDIVVHGLLNAPEDVRTATVTLLITESCQTTEGCVNVDRFLPLWKDMFDSKNGTDSIVLQKSRFVFADVMEYLFVVVEAFLSGDSETLPPSLTSVFTTAFHILSLHPVEHYTERSSSRLLNQLHRCALRSGVCAPLLRLGVVAHQHCGGTLRDLCRMVRIDKCSDEALLCETCHLIVYAPEEDVDCKNVLLAVEILLTRTDVEPKILSQALQRLESIINANTDLDPKKLDQILCLVEKLRARKDMSSKEARVLHRDTVLFMGKYGNNNYLIDKLGENTIIAELKDKLILNLPNSDEGTIYKLNLQSILHQATTHEDPDALQKLLSVICAALSSNKDPNLQLSLTLVIRSLCRAHAHSSVDAACIQQAVLLCDTQPCLTALITYISEEKSPGVRKMLSDALEGLLLQHPGSEATEQLVKVAAEHAAVMMTSCDPTVKSGGLNITETLLSALKDNHLLQTKVLPDILTLILETGDLDSKNIFKTTAYKILVENLEIYPKDTIGKVSDKLLKNLFKINSDLSQEFERRILKDKFVVTLEFLKEINVDFDKLLDCCKLIDVNFEMKLFLMAVSGLVSDNVMDEVLLKIEGLDFKCVEDMFLLEAVLKFFEVHAKDMIERKRQMAVSSLGHVISDMSIENILRLSTHIKSCLSSYATLLEPNDLTYYVENWFTKTKIMDVIKNINKDSIQIESLKVLRALNLYLDVLNVSTCAFKTEMLNLCDVALDVYVGNEKFIENYKEFVGVLLKISLRFQSLEEIKEFVLKSVDKVGNRFVKCFIEEFLDYFLIKPYILVEMKPVYVILNDIMKAFLKKKSTERDCIKILELVDTVWPLYESQTTFEAKHSLLSQITRLPIQLQANSAALQWATALVAEGEREERVKLVGVLPGVGVCSSAYRAFASQLPARLSELSGSDHSALQAILDATADTADEALLDILMKLADCDPSKGWWDEAMASCMAVIARRGDCILNRFRINHNVSEGFQLETRHVSVKSIAESLYENRSIGVCKRLLIPLLRYSTSSFCEQFYSGIINCLLSTLVKWVRVGDRDSQELRDVLQNHARVLALVTLAMEKIPLSSLKSQDSVLYSEVVEKQPSYLMRKVSSICVTLRKKSCPDNASEELKNCYRQFQIENYKCLCAAVCVTRPAAKFYDLLFDVDVWEKIFDCNVVRNMPLRTQWTQQKSVHTVADASSSNANRNAGTSLTRTRMFLRTLSENPLQFDLMDVDEEPRENSHEIELVVNELNSQDGADTLTALVSHVAELTHTEWRTKVAVALTADCHSNVKWTLAQMICNCREELKPHGEALRPSLVALVANTAIDHDGRKVLNNLHIDVLETVLHWKDLADLPESSKDHLNSTIEYLINTSIDTYQQPGVFNMLVGLLGRLLDVYGAMVEVPWRCFQMYLADVDSAKTERDKTV